jgi:hypothetical protein
MASVADRGQTGQPSSWSDFVGADDDAADDGDRIDLAQPIFA